MLISHLILHKVTKFFPNDYSFCFLHFFPALFLLRVWYSGKARKLASFPGARLAVMVQPPLSVAQLCQKCFKSPIEYLLTTRIAHVVAFHALCF